MGLSFAKPSEAPQFPGKPSEAPARQAENVSYVFDLKMGVVNSAISLCMMVHPLENERKACEHGHRNSWLTHETMEMFNSYVCLPEGI